MECKHEVYIMETPHCIETAKEKTAQGTYDDVETYCQKCGTKVVVRIMWKEE